MANTKDIHRIGSLLNVSLSTICGSDRAKHYLEPVRDFLRPHAPKIAAEVHCGIVEIDAMQAVAVRENQRITEEDLAKLALSLDTNGDGQLDAKEVTIERVFGLLKAVASEGAADARKAAA